MNKKENDLEIWSRNKEKGRTTFFKVEWKNEEKLWDYVKNSNINYLLASI